MKINSISGGKSSCFMALNFECDMNVFALVELGFHTYTPKEQWDMTYLKAYEFMRSKLGDGFWASAEDDKTLDCVMRLSEELEANLGYSNLAVVSASQYSKISNYDSLIEKTKYLPNARKRLCTEKLKVEPIYHWTKRQTKEVVEMAIGFRLDELERTVKLYFKQTPIKNRVPFLDFDMQGFINKWQIPNYIVKWWDRLEVEKKVKSGALLPKVRPYNKFGNDYFRVPSFPLIEFGITRFEVEKFWQSKPNYEFPQISNCIGCFHHSIKELQKQWFINTSKMEWFARHEDKSKHRFGSKYTYREIKELPVQMDLDFEYGGGLGGCNSGSCTD